MSAWKVIVATAVIFLAGLLAGGVAMKRFGKESKSAAGPDIPMHPLLRTQYVRFLDRELGLTPEQTGKLTETVQKGQERARILYGLITDDLREELNFTREEIRAQLTPEQREKFDALRKKHKHRMGDWPAGGELGRRGPKKPPEKSEE